MLCPIKCLSEFIIKALSIEEDTRFELKPVLFSPQKHEHIGNVTAPLNCQYIHNAIIELGQKSVDYTNARASAEPGGVAAIQAEANQLIVDKTISTLSKLKACMLYNALREAGLSENISESLEIVEGGKIVKIKNFSCDYATELKETNVILEVLELQTLAA